MSLLALALAAALPACAGDAQFRAEDAAALSRSAAGGQTPADAKELGALAFSGGAPSETAVSADGRGLQRSNLTLQKARGTQQSVAAAVPAPKAVEGLSPGSLPNPMSFLAKTWAGIAAGAVTGLAAAWLFSKKHYGAGIGVTAGALVGSLLLGPIGAILGAILGGLAGHAIHQKLKQK